MNIRISTLLAVLLAMPVAAMADNANDPSAANPATLTVPAHKGHHGGGMMAVLRRLDLTDDQRSQIKLIVKDTRAKNKGITDPQERRLNLENMRQQIESVLTDIQRVKFDDAMKQMQAARKGGQGTPPPANPGS